MVEAALIKWALRRQACAGSKIAVIAETRRSPALRIRAQVPAGYKVAPHWHPGDENLTILSVRLHWHGRDLDE